MNDFAEWVSAQGFDPEALTASQKKALQAAWRAEQRGAVAVAEPTAPTPVPVPVVDSRAAGREVEAAETERIGGIRRVCGDDTATAATAIRENWDVRRAEMQAELLRLRARNTPAPASGILVGAMPTGATPNVVLEAALAQATGSPNLDRWFSADVLQAAHTSFRGRLSLGQLLIMGAQAGGYRAAPGERVSQGNLRELLRAAFTPAPSAANFSTVSLSGILNNAANKDLLAGYMEEDQSWREIGGIKNVSDFKQATSYRMLDNMAYEEVAANGKMKSGEVSSESYTRQAKTYAKMFSVTRQDFINDDLSAFDDLRNRLGRGAAQKFNDVFWTEFMSDAANFWTTARTNYITGATTTLLTDGVGLGLGVKAFRQMTSPTADGAKRIAGRPEILLVPPELEGAADVLHVNQNLGMVSGATANIYAGKYRPVVCPWLSDSAFTGYSTTAWFLLRNPGIAPAVVVSFLDGMQTPTVESADADFDTLGVVFRGYHDFGVDQAEYLCGIKSKGAA